MRFESDEQVASGSILKILRDVINPLLKGFRNLKSALPSI